MAWPDAHLERISWGEDELLSKGGKRGAGLRDGGLKRGAAVEVLRGARTGDVERKESKGAAGVCKGLAQATQRME